MRKRICAGLALLLAVVTPLSGCRGARPLPEGMEEETVGEAARSVVDMLLEENYQGVVELFRPDLREAYSVTADTVREMMDTVSGAGGYVKTTQTLVVGGRSKGFDEPYAAAAVYCEHRSKDVIYEISFDTALNIIGLQAKAK